ncbi:MULTISPECIES: YybS family protein [Cytobacillus]|uniref:YybS family protein n=1 Tax=Cytobacillus stercorigallinarum TaxID=2762240 RepID=A0ABR8QVZ8_9BACI|nr:YybS family protein [Cytobacillus stercorigallinarum]MBD7939597.1 YybS family protein [Cytobacillus stercorigallinarum]
MKNVHKLTEGAVLLAAFAVLLLMSLYLPIIGTIVTFGLPVPFMLFAAKNKRGDTAIFFVAAILISFIVGTITAIPLTLIFGLTGIVIGELIKLKKERTVMLLGGSLAFLAMFLLVFAGMNLLLNVNFVEELKVVLEQSMDMTKNMLSTLDNNEAEQIFKQLEATMTALETLLPSLLVLTSAIYVFIIQLIGVPIVRRFGIEVKKWRSFADISFPKSILWYFLITMVAQLFMKPEEGSFTMMAIVNLLFVFQLIMVIQGLSFIFFYSRLKNWPKVVPIAILVFTFLLPIFLYIVRILGIIDIGFDLRKRLDNRDA